MSGNGTGTPLAVRLLAEQRRRCLATILNAAEQSSWWERLSDGQQNIFRDQVKAAIAVFYDLARDVVKITDEDVSRNDLALDLIRSIHMQSTQIAQRLEVNR